MVKGPGKKVSTSFVDKLADSFEKFKISSKEADIEIKVPYL